MLPDWIEKVALVAVTAIVSLLGKNGYQWIVTRKIDNANAQHISSSSHLSALQLSDAMVREWIKAANEAERKLLQAHKNTGRAAELIIEMCRIIKTAGHPEIVNLETRVNDFLASISVTAQ